MGGYNTTDCLREKCDVFRVNGSACDYALEVHSSTPESDKSTRRVCGTILGPLASELSELEVVSLVLEEKVPLISDTVD